jgi:prepilin-type processing-associated H-X9-DG protein
MRRIHSRPARAHPPLQRAAPRKVRYPAFTLVELLVVIGIIAVLIGVLLPVLAGVAARGRDLKCQSNIRQCVQLFHVYAAENRGQFPFGFYWSPRGDLEGWYPAGTDPKVISVWTILSRMSMRDRSAETDQWGVSAVHPDSQAELPPFLRCPEAAQVQEHWCSYVVSLAAFVTPSADVQAGASRMGPPWHRLIERPAKTIQCSPFTALIWDTAVHAGMATNIGFVYGGDIDGQRIWTGATRPQQRYYSTYDPLSRVPPGSFGNNKPVQLDVGSHRFKNIDPPPGTIWPYQGNLRFRHRRETTCNVGFADGSVRSFTGKFTTDARAISHDALRRSFMVKWPSGAGVAPSPVLPH